MAEYLDDRFALERAFWRATTYRKATSRYPSVGDTGDIQYYQLYSFALAATRAYARLSSRGQNRLRGYIKDGLKSDAGLIPIALEMAIAVHLWTAGFDVEFTDAEGNARFDFIARRDGIELEVDCKSLSGDVGRSIHRRRLLELFHRIKPAIDLCVMRGESVVLQITIPSALHGLEDYMKSLAELVNAAVSEGRDLDANGIGTIAKIPSL